MAVAIKKSCNRMYKYESIRIEWTKHFQKHHTENLAFIVKCFFDSFHESHKRFQYAVGKIFDGTTHVLVYPDIYRQIKEELEKKTGEELPEVSFVSDVSFINERLTFQYPQGKSYWTLSMSLKEKNDQIKRRKKEEAVNHASEVQRILYSRPPGRVMAFDVEVYEHDHSILLEIGFVITTLTSPQNKRFFHYIIKETLDFKNKDEVPDNRERFQFGLSQRLSLKEAIAKFKQHLAQTEFLVTHSGSHDEEYLANYGISVAGKPMFDTQILALALLPAGPSAYSLKRLLSDLAIPFDEDVLHNAGNDAAYTMEVFLALEKKLRKEEEERQLMGKIIKEALEKVGLKRRPEGERKPEVRQALGISSSWIKYFLVALVSFLVLAIFQYILKN